MKDAFARQTNCVVQDFSLMRPFEYKMPPLHIRGQNTHLLLGRLW